MCVKMANSNFGTSSYQAGHEGDFSKLSQQIGTHIQKISQNASSMQRIVVQLGTPADNQQLRNQLHQIQHYTGQLAKDTSKSLKDLGAISLQSTEQRVLKLQRERLLNDFTAALNSFQSLQREAAQREKDEVKRVRTASVLSPPDSSKEALVVLDETKSQPFQSSQQRQMQMQEEDVDVQALVERERAIRQLESDIVDVNTIFKELATMVHEQGEMIDSIEANVETAQMRVEEGTNQLSTAASYQTKIRRRKCFIAIIAAVVAIIIIGIIIWQSR